MAKRARGGASRGSSPRGGRPPHQPTSITRGQVEALTAYGVPQEEIADFIGIAKHTLVRHYAQEMKAAHPKLILNLGQSLYRQAVGAPAQYDADRNRLRAEQPPVVAATIFMLKARANWADRVDVGNEKDTNGAPVPFKITRRDEKL
jgi:hypothetical protein